MAAATTAQSRRGLSAATRGRLAALAAEALARPSAVEAGHGGALIIGATNLGHGTQTTLQTKSTGPDFKAKQYGTGAALRGESHGGHGVVGQTSAGDKYGVQGINSAGGPGSVGVYGISPSGVGVASEIRVGRSAGTARARCDD